MATANKNPKDVFNYKVKFSTKKLSDGDIFIESHTATDPTGTFDIALNFTKPSGNPFGPIVVVPLSSNTGK